MAVLVRAKLLLQDHLDRIVQYCLVESSHVCFDREEHAMKNSVYLRHFAQWGFVSVAHHGGCRLLSFRCLRNV